MWFKLLLCLSYGATEMAENGFGFVCVFVFVHTERMLLTRLSVEGDDASSNTLSVV